MTGTIPSTPEEDVMRQNRISRDAMDIGGDGKNKNAHKHKVDLGAIASPIPLLAYTGTLYIGITGGYLVLIDNKSIALHWTVYAIPVIFPVILLCAIIYLIVCHHEKLYSPSDFSGAEYFLRTLSKRSHEFVSMKFIDDLNITDAAKFDPDEIKKPKYRAVFDRASSNLSAFEALMTSFSTSHLEILHSWYNATERHDLALTCMDLAIAKGAASSKNFSYRSASLRKLNRLFEANASAQLSITLDPLADHSDAHYNLAKIGLMLGNYSEVRAHLDKARLSATINKNKLEVLEGLCNKADGIGKK